MVSDRLLPSEEAPARPASNRRTAFRLPTALAVVVRCPGAPTLATMTEDLSAGGLCFRAPEALARGTSVELSFTIDDTQVSVAGTVAHVSTDPFGAAVGVSFTNADGVTTSRLVRFITTRERARLPTVPIMYSLIVTSIGRGSRSKARPKNAHRVSCGCCCQDRSSRANASPSSCTWAEPR